MNKPDNPSAFPDMRYLDLINSINFSPITKERIYIESKGMSLRDYFAAAALTGMLAQETEEWHWNDHQARARAAYAQADAMLTEREK